MATSKHLQPEFLITPEAIIESAKGLTSFYGPLETITGSSDDFWTELERFCVELLQYPQALEALSRIYANSILDFERGLFCGMFSVLVARRLGIKKARIRSLFYAALLQDVGSYMEDYGISDYFNIVRAKLGGKPSVSTSSQNRSHALVGSSLIEDVMSDDSLVAELVLHHHAKDDGTGYPTNVGENQLSIEQQILIVANEVSDLLAERGGFDDLYDCIAELKLSSVMYFREVNGAAYSLLAEAANSSHYHAQLSTSDAKALMQLEAMCSFSANALAYSSDLLEFEHYASVRQLRALIKKLDLLMRDTGFAQALDKKCGNSVAIYLQALPNFLERIMAKLKTVQKSLPQDAASKASDLNSELKSLISSLKPNKAFSLFS
ncbi:MAG: hypothetical protein MK096_03180 [Oleiphilaceae bacterium]|uniref:HD-GYP domain-containing protein n=1 Tax=Oleiphilus sp. HI0125 TaxID=1822266 RepID=UPI0007C3A233|nr:HD domain-containing phosphohydrolase [Oleiphilus sp. HI0125]KZZ58586.1 hypothetical protein A3762_07485 [Oleiphilus sp. HI0125]MCH2157769.1 hypothetical protein [Oleiphilaceae bacterium]